MVTTSTSSTDLFLRGLIAWHSRNPRPMPWKNTDDPYKIWLSEIILQQTQVKQGLPYYEKFVSSFPDVHTLAQATEDVVLKAWQGLGYNSRARHLHATAQYVSQHLEGIFPDTYTSLKTLKGVGEYTAAAIASFAFGQSVPVIDGNVYRVISRYFGIEEILPGKALKQKVLEISKTLISQADPATYNQAIMNFGALQCKPKNPDCMTCPFAPQCAANREGKVSLLPVKAKQKPRKARYFHYFVCTFGGDILLRKRLDEDIWKNMYDFPLLETGSKRIPSWKDRKVHLQSLTGAERIRKTSLSDWFRQVLSHRLIHARFETCEIEGKLQLQGKEYLLADRENLSNFAFPKIVDLYFRENSINLEKAFLSQQDYDQ